VNFKCLPRISSNICANFVYFTRLFTDNFVGTCMQVPKQKCQSVPRQVPKQSCSQTPAQSCTQVPREVCQQVPQQIPRQVSVPRQRKICPVGQKIYTHTITPGLRSPPTENLPGRSLNSKSTHTPKFNPNFSGLKIHYSSYTLQGPTSKIRNKCSQKRKCVATVPISTFMCL
jgi:hypothetical protein